MGGRLAARALGPGAARPVLGLGRWPALLLTLLLLLGGRGGRRAGRLRCCDSCLPSWLPARGLPARGLRCPGCCADLRQGSRNSSRPDPRIRPLAGARGLRTFRFLRGGSSRQLGASTALRVVRLGGSSPPDRLLGRPRAITHNNYRE
jgi:hypothetical protein